MNKSNKSLFDIVLFFTIIGLVVRLSTPLSISMPINDGGLFFAMIQDLQRNKYTLPFNTSYNSANIPFAYPPFGFYFFALMADISDIRLLDLIRIIPAVISALTIPAFYLLMKEMFDSKPAIALGVMAFTLVPRSFEWIIMGGGVTRAFGFLFALLALRQNFRLFTVGSRFGLVSSIALSSLVVYAHPEAIVHTIIGSIFFYIWKDRSFRGAINVFLLATGVILLTSPWWWTVISRHGVSALAAPVTAVDQNNLSFATRFFTLFIFLFTDEPFLNIFGALGLVGILHLLSQKRYFIPAWLVVIHTLEPRSAPLYMMVPLAMAFGHGLDKLILPGLRNPTLAAPPLQSSSPVEWTSQLLSGRIVKIFLGFIFAYGVMSDFHLASQTLQKRFTLTAEDAEAFQWAGDSTSADSRFLVITQENPLLDPASEWFPALAERRSVATVYGYEWVNDGLFGLRLENARALQNCANQNVPCIDSWRANTGNQFSHILIRKMKNGISVEVSLATHLELSLEFEKVYESELVVIFAKK